MRNGDQEIRENRMVELINGLPTASEPWNEELSTKLQHYLALAKEGKSPNTTLQESKDYKNPYTHEQIVAYYGIVEHGSNYTSQVYDFTSVIKFPEEYYDVITARQRRPPESKRTQK